MPGKEIQTTNLEVDRREGRETLDAWLAWLGSPERMEVTHGH
jgi:hypothetical protein